MSVLRRRHRRLTREVAREAFIACEGDCESAKEYFNAHPRVYQIDVSTLLLMLQIAIQLWNFWQSRNLSQPSVIASEDESEALGEGFFSEVDDND